MKNTMHTYGDCYYCGGAVEEKVIPVDFRWMDKLYIIEDVPVGVCKQCGEKYFTAAVSKSIDKLIESREVKRMETVPVKEFSFSA